MQTYVNCAQIHKVSNNTNNSYICYNLFKHFTEIYKFIALNLI